MMGPFARSAAATPRPTPGGRLEVVSEEALGEDGRPPLLLIHGGRHAAWCWERWCPILAAHGWTSYAVSLRGHGGSAGTVRGATLSDYVDDVVSTARQLSVPPVLVGHSMGGLVVKLALARMTVPGAALVAPAPEARPIHALRLAAKHPKTVLGVLAGRQVPFTREQLLSQEVPEEAAQRVLARLGQESLVAQYQVLLAHTRPPVSSCPVLVLGSPDDTLVAPREIMRTADRYHAQVRWFPGLRHDLMLETRSSEVVGALVDWLESHVLQRAGHHA